MFPSVVDKKSLVVQGLARAGWTVTDDPFHLLIPIRYAEGNLDLGRGNVFGAEKGEMKIAVRPVIREVGFSDGSLSELVGESLIYGSVLEETKPGRKFYLAIDRLHFTARFQSRIAAPLVRKGVLSFLIYSLNGSDEIEFYC